jgi:CRISPR-associated protein Cas1
MGAITLLVDRRGATLELAARGVLVLRYPDGQQYRVGLEALENVIIQGEVGLSTALLRACHSTGVAVLLLPGRGKGEACHLFPTTTRLLKLRLGQFACHLDPVCRLRVARRIVAAKLAAQQEWLVAHGHAPVLHSLLAQTQEAPDIASLTGIEGAAAARYFTLWGQQWHQPWQFTTRNRRPPRDPVNSLLSLGYTLAGQSVGHLAARFGLDLSVGFLHVPKSGRPALMLDLLEPLRPWVDEWVWQFLQGGMLTPAHFTDDPGLGCRLDKEGRAHFYAMWYKQVEAWLHPPARRAVARLLRVLRGIDTTLESPRAMRQA